MRFEMAVWLSPQRQEQLRVVVRCGTELGAASVE